MSMCLFFILIFFIIVRSISLVCKLLSCMVSIHFKERSSLSEWTIHPSFNIVFRKSQRTVQLNQQKLFWRMKVSCTSSQRVLGQHHGVNTRSRMSHVFHLCLNGRWNMQMDRCCVLHLWQGSYTQMNLRLEQHLPQILMNSMCTIIM